MPRPRVGGDVRGVVARPEVAERWRSEAEFPSLAPTQRPFGKNLVTETTGVHSSLTGGGRNESPRKSKETRLGVDSQVEHLNLDLNDFFEGRRGTTDAGNKLPLRPQWANPA